MKYGYTGVESKDLIRKYEHNVSNNTIIITFLDDSSYEVPYNEESEQLILDKMLEQAQQRSESRALQNAMQKRRLAFAKIMLNISTILLNSANYYRTESNNTKIFCSVLNGIIAVTIALNGAEFKFTSDEINELKKYDLYLAIKEKLENKNDSNTCNMTEGNLNSLNINTLDNYSLRDIERIRDHLDRDEEWKSFLKKSNKRKVLAKKRGI